MTKVLPTGTCFDDAIEMLADIVTHQPEIRDDVWLIHAICKPKQCMDDDIIAHAWLQNHFVKPTEAIIKGFIDDELMIINTPADKYVNSLGVIRQIGYSWREAGLMNQMHGTYGPWDSEFLKYCADNENSMG